MRQKAFIVNPGEPNIDINTNDYESDSPEYADNTNDDDYDYPDFINPRKSSPRDRELRSFNEESSKDISSRRSHLLRWILDTLEDRIS